MNIRLVNVGGETMVVPPSSDLGFKLQHAREFARRNAVNPAWRAFKDKWDGKTTPRRGTAAFEIFAAEAQAVQESCQAIIDDIVAI